MKVMEYPEEARGIALDFNGARWTQPWDVKVLLWLARNTMGSILEIGCNEGRTLREFALAFPDRRVIGVDSSELNAKRRMAVEQRHEQPPQGRVGFHASTLRNVSVVDYPSAMVWDGLLGRAGRTAPGEWGEVGFVFIDGDHSYRGVKEDTEAALDYLLPRSRGEPPGQRVIAWHDCYDGAPAWCGVQRFLREEVNRFWEVTVIKDTWVAFVTF